MPNQQPIAEVERLLVITREMNEVFDAYARQVRQEILTARLHRDMVKVAELETALNSAREDVERMDHALGKALLSTALVDSLEAELTGKVREAKALLDEMEKLGRTLDRIARGAAIASQALQVVSRLVV